MDKLLGIDPGRSKTGLALTDECGKILALRIAATECLNEELEKFLGADAPTAIIMGDGTNNKKIAADVAKIFPTQEIFFVDEAHSTEEARALYWQENPPRGWRKIIPLGLQVPPVPLDDYAAVVQLRRWLKNKKS